MFPVVTQRDKVLIRWRHTKGYWLALVTIGSPDCGSLWLCPVLRVPDGGQVTDEDMLHHLNGIIENSRS